MNDLNQKIALITGGGRGLGAAICDSLSESGAIAIAADIQFNLENKTPSLTPESERQIIPFHLDITDEQQIETAIQKIIAQYGRIDILVNNAGTDKTLSIEELDIADWDRVLNVNLRAPFILTKSVFAQMRQQGGGHIVNIVSTAAKRAWANASAYHASKWGLLGLSQAMHVEGRPHQIKVTSIIAGGMRTPFLLDRFPDIDVSTLQDPRNVAETIRYVLMQPTETVISEMMVLPMKETSWP
jgi:NAD(P)-dependent dehydrogenase (short-subunit alcohol dehydrogenase family)